MKVLKKENKSLGFAEGLAKGLSKGGIPIESVLPKRGESLYARSKGKEKPLAKASRFEGMLKEQKEKLSKKSKR